MSTKKIEERHSFVDDGKKYLQCKSCYEYVAVDEDISAITCSMCVQRKCLTSMPMDKFFKSVKPKTGRPPGWHFMNEYVDKDGNVFHKGKEQPKLKGTLKPTKVKPPKKRKKKSKDEQMFDLAKKYKKKLKLKRKSK